MTPNFYTWKNFRCAYTVHTSSLPSDDKLALVLIHPIGVGLSGRFWERFAQAWFNSGQRYPLYNPDLLGCGASDMPHVAYYPSDWAQQLRYFIETVIKKPIILVVQGALLPVALHLIQNPPQPNWIKGVVLAGPPAWRIITEEKPAWKQNLVWNLFFNSPLGSVFYRYARRRQFLESFSIRQLFADADTVDEQWLNTLEKGAENPDSRYAVFSFLAGFWRENYSQSIKSIAQPTLVVVGKEASSINRIETETPEQRLELYLKQLPKGQGCQISGRNVLPYESTLEFTSIVAEFVNQLANVF